MKSFILMLYMIGLIYTNTNAQWVDKGEYKEFKASDYRIKQLILIPNSNRFAILDIENNFNIYDSTTTLLFSKNIKIEVDNQYLRVNSTGDYYFTLKTVYNNISNQNVELLYNVNCKVIKSDSVLFTKDLPGSKLSGTYLDIINSYPKDIFVDFIPDLNKTIICESVIEYEGFNSESTVFSQYLFIFDNFTKSIQPLNGSFNFSANQTFDKFITTQFKKTEVYSGSSFYKSENNNYFKFINLKSNSEITISYSTFDRINTTNNKTGYIPNNLCLAHNKNIFIATQDKEINSYQFLNDTILKLNTQTLASKPIKLLFSQNDNYLIYALSNNIIEIYTSASNQLIKSYTLIDKLNADTLINLPDGTGFMCSSPNGTVKLFQPEFMSKGLKSYFTADKQVVPINDTVHFFSFPGGKPKTFMWNFGDGSTTDSINPSHSYSQIGTYTVSLIVGDGVIYDTSYKTITVINNIVVDFDSDIHLSDIPATVKFLNYCEGDNLNYTWNFGDSTSSTDHNPSHTYSQYGSWDVSLTAKNDYLTKTLTHKAFLTTKKKTDGVEDCKDNTNSLFTINGDILQSQSNLDNLFIYNLLGEEVFSITNIDSINLNSLTLSSSCYIIKATSNQTVEIKKYLRGY